MLESRKVIIYSVEPIEEDLAESRASPTQKAETPFYEEDFEGGQDFDEFEFEVAGQVDDEGIGMRVVGGDKVGGGPDGFRRNTINPVVQNEEDREGK